MESIKSCAVCFAGVLMCSVVLGCSSNEHPELRRVSGIVTYHGEAVADATIAFYNDESPRLATGRTDEAGRFKLTSFEKDDGALPGEHRVVVSKVDAMDQEPQKLSMDEAMTARPNRNRSRQLLPKKYASNDTTPLVVTVTEKGPNDLAIDLNDEK